MRPYFISTKKSELQDNLYFKLNTISQTNKTFGRFCSIPVSLLDVAMDTFVIPLSAIEDVAMVAINLIGAAFSAKFSLKDALAYTEFSLVLAALMPVKLALAPFKIIFQLFAIIINPEKVQSIKWDKPTFRR